jgi:hypothetical protein
MITPENIVSIPLQRNKFNFSELVYVSLHYIKYIYFNITPASSDKYFLYSYANLPVTSSSSLINPLDEIH